MAWPEIEPTTPHLTYLLLSFFLILYALFSELIRNKIHLSEPPLATLTGIAFGPRGATVLDPTKWGWEDNITQEVTRIIVGVQVFAVGIDLPPAYLKSHWKGIMVLLGPNMIIGWLVSAAIIHLVLGCSATTSFIIAACLTPTDPVLSASVLGEARFSQRIPKRVRHLLSAESGCNDGSAFPFLYVGLFAAISPSVGSGIRDWFLDVLLWQCLAGVVFGAIVGLSANKLLRFSEKRGYVQESTLFVFYFLLAIFSVGVGSTLGLDDFLVAFTAGTAFCWDGWFKKKTKKMHLPVILDLMLNSAFFVYFGAIIPWETYYDRFGVWRMLACSALILVFRRIPAMLSMKRLIPELKTWSETLFAGHFGPMGVGALFLAIEARARLETGTSEPEPHPPKTGDHLESINAVWPVICFVVLCSILVHGFSALIMSTFAHFTTHPKERTPLLGAADERLYGMANEEGEFTDESSHSSDEDTPGRTTAQSST